MWQCPKCDRVFQITNQQHICVKKDVGELFIGKPDDMVLAWDTLTNCIMSWQPNTYSATTKSIVYTSKKAWLIIKPMAKELDVKFYHQEKQVSDLIKKHVEYPKNYAHHIRINNESQVNEELLNLLKSAHEWSIME